MNIRRGRQCFCSNCIKVVETRGLREGYSQVSVHAILAKRRQVICATDSKGSGGCGKKWYTLEIPMDQVLGLGGKRG